MPNPYRERYGTPEAPLQALRSRKRMATGAGWAAALVAGEIVLATAPGALPPWIPAALASFMLGAGAVVAVGVATAGNPTGRWRGWLFRGAMAAYVLVLGLLQLGLDLAAGSYVLGALLVVASVAYIMPLSRHMALPELGAGARIFLELAMWICTGLFFFRSAPLWHWVTPIVLGWMVIIALFLHTHLRIERHQWWFDREMAAPGEWVLLLVHRDKHAEVLCADETLGTFASEGEARHWLPENGYVSARRAMRERLVSEVPPDITASLSGARPARPGSPSRAGRWGRWRALS